MWLRMRSFIPLLIFLHPDYCLHHISYPTYIPLLSVHSIPVVLISTLFSGAYSQNYRLD